MPSLAAIFAEGCCLFDFRCRHADRRIDAADAAAIISQMRAIAAIRVFAAAITSRRFDAAEAAAAPDAGRCQSYAALRAGAASASAAGWPPAAFADSFLRPEPPRRFIAAATASPPRHCCFAAD
jgi:hypothetical protein